MNNFVKMKRTTLLKYASFSQWWKTELPNLSVIVRSGRVETAIASDIIEKVHRIVFDDSRVKVQEVADTEFWLKNWK